MGVNTIGLLSAASDPESASAEACRRLAEFFQPYSAKELARMFGVSPRTAQTWRQGQWPIARHQHAIVQRFGRAWLDWVYGPLLPAEDRGLALQLAEIEGRLAAVRVSLEELGQEGGPHGAVAGAAAKAGALAAPAGAAEGVAADGGRRAGGRKGKSLAGMGARAGALALALVVALAAAPDQNAAIRVLRGGGGGRVVRLLGAREVL